MTDLAPPTVTVPTELERSDGFVDLSILAAAVLTMWELALHGVPIWAMAPIVVLVAIFTLTGEPAADVPYIGAVAAGVRSKLGLRRAHEWCLAYVHYFKVRIWPDWMTHWNNSRLRFTLRTKLPWLRWPHVNGVRLNSKRLRFWRQP